MQPSATQTLSLPSDAPFTVTIFGAESTGKTTLSRQLAHKLNAQWLYEFARPYLELTHAPITIESMSAIWQGQRVLQTMKQSPVVIQDTDLFSTVGYWQFPHWHHTLGDCPPQLIEHARQLASDLYIITPSTIPFEKDPLRYGGDVREGSDTYWINVCEQYQLPYVVLQTTIKQARFEEALSIITTRRNQS